MANINKERWMRLESRAREGQSDPGVTAAARMGALFRVPPAQVVNVSAVGGVGSVLFRWNAVQYTAAGKPLEALARYKVYYKVSTQAEIPPININDADTYDGIVFADNTQVVLPVGRQLIGGQWVQENVAVRVTAVDRSGREGKPSTQVQGTATTTRSAIVVDVGYIEAFEGEMITHTVVWDGVNITVPAGSFYIVTVWPVLGIYTIPGSGLPGSEADLFAYAEHHFYGLFSGGGLSEPTPVLPAGSYTDLNLTIYHYSVTVGGFTCASGTDTQTPLYNFDRDSPGLMRIADYIIEATSAGVTWLGGYVFEKQLWLVWQVPE